MHNVMSGGGEIAGQSGAVTDREQSGRSAKIRTAMTVFVPIAVFDIAGPIIVQAFARNHGASQTAALAASGIPPAFWELVTIAWRRRIDAIGALVLSGIILSTLLGLVTGSAKLYLIDGAVLGGAFGVAFLASLLTARPVMFHFALAGNGGPDSQKGKEFAALWQYEGFRRTMRVMTMVWGVGLVLQAVVNIVIIESASTNQAFFANKVLPYVTYAVLGAWTVFYGIRAKKRGEAASAAAAEKQPTATT